MTDERRKQEVLKYLHRAMKDLRAMADGSTDDVDLLKDEVATSVVDLEMVEELLGGEKTDD